MSGWALHQRMREGSVCVRTIHRQIHLGPAGREMLERTGVARELTAIV